VLTLIVSYNNMSLSNRETQTKRVKIMNTYIVRIGKKSTKIESKSLRSIECYVCTVLLKDSADGTNAIISRMEDITMSINAIKDMSTVTRDRTAKLLRHKGYTFRRICFK